MSCRPTRSAALSAGLGAPLPPRAFMMLSSCWVMKPGKTIASRPLIVATNPPAARAESADRWAAAMSSGASPWRAGAARSLKMRGELTIAACSGWASGTRMTSMRNKAVLES